MLVKYKASSLSRFIVRNGCFILFNNKIYLAPKYERDFTVADDDFDIKRIDVRYPIVIVVC